MIGVHVNMAGLAFRECKNAFKGKAKKLVVGTIALIPLLYGALYLWAFTDPYKTLDAVPVAVVIEDRGAMINGEMRNVGQEVKNRLKEMGSGKEGFQWNFVSRAQAGKGLEDGRYFMTATIPASFSECIASAEYDTPRRATMHVSYDRASNMLASQIGETAFHAIRSEISEAIAEEYWEHTFAKINAASDRLGEAANGADKLSEGSQSLQKGSGDLAAGSHRLSDAMHKLRGGLADLETGSNALSQGNIRTEEGAGKLARKMGDLNAGIKQLHEGSRAVSSGADRLYTGTRKLSAAGEELKKRVKESSDATGRDIIKLFIRAQNPGVTKDDVLENLEKIAVGLEHESHLLNSKLTLLAGGADSLSAGSLQMKNGADTLEKGLSAAADGSASLAAGSGKLAESLGDVSRGSAKLSRGIYDASRGAEKTADGSASLAAGAGELYSHTPELSEGAAKLHQGLSEAQEKGRIRNTAEKSRMMSAPVALDENNYSRVKNYGTGFAPYFISIGLWVGALIATFTLRVMNRRALLCGMNPIKSTFISFVPFAVMGVVQSVVLMGVIHGLLRLQINNVPAFYAVGIFTALAFMAIIQMIMSVFGIPGKLVAIILLMLQITGSAGTFPIQMTPGFFRAVHPFLPMTYSVMGLRQAMAGTGSGFVPAAIGFLVVFALIAFILSTLAALRKQNVNMTDLHPVITLE